MKTYITFAKKQEVDKVKKEKYKMGKLGKYQFMRRYKEIRSYLPDTRLANKSNIRAMIQRYDSLFIKPDKGTGGHGILKLSRYRNKYILKAGSISKQFGSFDAMYSSIHRLLTRNKFVVQKGIRLLQVNKRPFDIRVMVQKNKSRRLVVTGIIGRLARPGKIVTNYHSGGTPLPIGSLLKPHIGGAKRGSYIRRIERLGKEASVILGKTYTRKKAFGVDIAIGPNLRPWILEINTKPDKSIFNTLKNKTMYKRVIRYSKM
jgi:hypothetical protein